ncbi:MAG: OmpH family outer membrane protein [Chlorobiota bacterium]
MRKTWLWVLLCASSPLWAQLKQIEQLLTGPGTARVGFINSEEIRKRYPEAQQAEQRLRSAADDWQRTLEEMARQIGQLEEEIRKHRLLWTEEERRQKEAELERLRRQREEFFRRCFAPGGRYDSAAAAIYQPVEAKIFAAVQEVAVAEGYDFVWDKSRHPLVFAHPKFDLTVKVLKRLGVDTKDLEAQQQQHVEQLERQREGSASKEERRRAPRRRPAPGEQAPSQPGDQIPETPDQDRSIPR